ncbi:MAG TPA: hypothetical protein VGD37_27095 [Kofleriaceae bacterium]|jgi:hypothetical protein
MPHRLAALVAVGFACAACGAEATSFRPVDRSDPDRAGPPSAAYEVHIAGQLVAQAHAWSSGGYMSSGGEPMTHVGFRIVNRSAGPVIFDGDALELAAFDDDSTRLPATRLTSITPLGPSLIVIQPAMTTLFATYFLLPVRPRAVETMEVRWTLHAGDGEYHQITGFVRDDDAPVAEHARQPEP